mmetsp:Transcript_30041/g.71258  ORF Transcript_30041/g.71258 Transcript_30041/m.71258 type:complete len:229 (-) Transcript_30041:638-1324(-)
MLSFLKGHMRSPFAFTDLSTVSSAVSGFGLSPTLPLPPPKGTAYGAAEKPGACTWMSVSFTGVLFFSSSRHFSAQQGIALVFIMINFAFLFSAPEFPTKERSSQCSKSAAKSSHTSGVQGASSPDPGEEAPSSLTRAFFEFACFTIRVACVFWCGHAGRRPAFTGTPPLTRHDVVRHTCHADTWRATAVSAWGSLGQSPARACSLQRRQSTGRSPPSSVISPCTMKRP